MTRADFKYADNFPTLTDEQINSAYEDVCVMFSGVLQLWGVLNETIREAKRNLCINLITAWYLADMNPSAVTGVVSNGGMALGSKSIGGTSVSFSDMEAQEGLKQLNSNLFGQKALIMIQSAPERYGIYA
jgi:hypothetical protein